MTGARTIAAVTSALRSRLERGMAATVPGAKITTRPPDKARAGHSGNQINLFLYLTSPNAACRNQFVDAGDGAATSQPPLALDLYYLLSVYGNDDDDDGAISHRLLDRAMTILHHNPVLSPAELAASAGAGRIGDQTMSVTLIHLSLDDMTKLWSAFQTEFRLSVAYQVSAVLLDTDG